MTNVQRAGWWTYHCRKAWWSWIQAGKLMRKCRVWGFGGFRVFGFGWWGKVFFVHLGDVWWFVCQAWIRYRMLKFARVPTMMNRLQFWCVFFKPCEKPCEDLTILGYHRSDSFTAPLRLSNDPMTLVMLTVHLPTRAEELCYWAEDLDSALVTSFGYRNLGGGLLTVQCVSAIILSIDI